MDQSIVFLLGAGFSAPFDIPTMKPFLQSFIVTAERKYPGLYGTLTDHLSKLQRESDIESLLSSLSDAERLPYSWRPGVEMSADLCDWAQESRLLKAHLASYIIERCELFDRERASTLVGPLMARLSTNRAVHQVHLFTTNYDRIIEHVCESRDVAMSDGFGHPIHELAAPWKRDFSNRLRLYKLHGSVTYYVDKESDREPSYLRLDRGYPLPSPDYRLTRGGHNIEPLMVLPTLEKDALGELYGHLHSLFVESMSRTKLVIAIGTSLRDAQLVSVINYRAPRVVVLLVDTHPESAAIQIPSVSTVKLRASAEEFLSVSSDRLVDLIETCAKETEIAAIEEHVSAYAEGEAEEIRHRSAMTVEQRDALGVVVSDDNEASLLVALQQLHGAAQSNVLNAVVARSLAPNVDSVRKAAAGCLGVIGGPTAVGALSKIATEDLSSDVRLEAYLSLRRMESDEAADVLARARQKWSHDRYFLTPAGAT